MQVTKVEALTKTKWKVELDGQFAFVLYKKEISRFGIEVNGELSEELYEQIKKNVVLKRAKLRAMHLLTDMARTESQLRDKLKRNMYPEDVISQAIAYVKSFGYINDEAYIENFIQSKRETKSRKEIYALLLGKGVSSEQIDLVFEQCYEKNTEQEAISRLIRKRNVDILHASEQELHKGFQYDDIRQVIQNYKDNA